MRTPSDMPQPPRRRRSRGTKERNPNRGRITFVIIAVVLFVLVTSLRQISDFYTDKLWFDSLNLDSVWSGVLFTKLGLAFAFIAIFFVALWVNLYISERLAPVFRPTGGGDDELLERYHDIVAPRANLVRTVVSLLFAVIAGAGVAAKWNDWLLFRNSVNFGQKDATYNIDIGFYVFKLPFLSFVAGWLFSSLVIILFITAVSHYLNGGIRLQAPLQRTTPQVKAHLSVLLALLALVRAGQYWLERYQLVFSSRGYVNGSTYTDTRVQSRAFLLLALISLFAVVLFIANIWRRGWVLPGLAVGLWIFVAVLAGQAVPAFVQKFKVEPQQGSRERPYIAHNIAATREALDLTDKSVDTKSFAADGKLDQLGLADNAETIRNIRLWDPTYLRDTYQNLQALRQFYTVNDVDVDRYVIDGELSEVMLSPRDLDQSGLPNTSWEGETLIYTHGYGIMLSQANAVTSNGGPDLLVRDIPVQSTGGAPEVTRPGIYFGEGLSGYAIVNTDREEIDYQGAKGNVTTTYAGKDGIKLGSGVGGFFRRAAFAARSQDINPLISGNIKPQSKVIMHRDIKDRLQTVAPFLSYDADPYPVVLNGRIVYVVDAYTTTDRYPNAQQAETDDLPQGSGLNHSFNYVRNSVKATIDAYDGTVRLYVVDSTDPLIKAYQKAFPKLFTSGDKVPDELRAHFRYPEDLFRVQTAMWGRYHVTKPDDFYNDADRWSVAPDVGSGDFGELVSAQTVTTTPTDNTSPDQAVIRHQRIEPYYVLMKLPGENKLSFLILRPFVPYSKSDTTGKLTSFMVAKADPGDYGKIETYVMPSNRLPIGPQIAADLMNADDQVSSIQTQLCQRGSNCKLGNLLLIPIDQSLLYVRPIYLAAKGSTNYQLRKVIVSFQAGPSGDDNKVAVGDSLKEALDGLFGVAPATRESTQPSNPQSPTQNPGTATDQQVADLISQLNAAFDAADQAYKAGDPVKAAQQIAIAEGLARQLDQIRASRAANSGTSGTSDATGTSGTSGTSDSGGGGSGATTTTTTAPTTTTTGTNT